MKFTRKLIATVSALCLMSVSILPTSVSAEESNQVTPLIPTTVDINESHYQQLLDIGFNEEEAELCIDTLSAEEINLWLNCDFDFQNTNNNARTSNTVSVIERTLEHGTDTNVAGLNTGTYCGSVASAILLKYYKDYHPDKVALSNYTTTRQLFVSLLPYVQISGGSGSTIPSLTDGLEAFFNDNNEPHSVLNKVYDASDELSIRRMFMTMNMYLGIDKPLIACGDYPGSAGGHVVVIQYLRAEFDEDNNLISMSVSVNTGYGGSNATDYIDFIDFITSTDQVSANIDRGIVYLNP